MFDPENGAPKLLRKVDSLPIDTANIPKNLNIYPQSTFFPECECPSFIPLDIYAQCTERLAYSHLHIFSY